MARTCLQILLVGLLMDFATSAPQSPVSNSKTLVFNDKGAEDSKDDGDNVIITPPILPVIAHLENDPTTLLRQDKGLKPKPRFNLGPTSVSGSFSLGFGGPSRQSQAASQSFSAGASNQGFVSGSNSAQGNPGNIASTGSSASSSAFSGPGFSGSQSAAFSQGSSAALGFSQNGSGRGSPNNDKFLLNYPRQRGFSFPGPSSNRYPKVNYQTISYRPNNRRKPEQYQVIRIEV